MSFDKPTRNKLASMVGDCRRLLTDDIRDQLQVVYGLQPDGSAIAVASLTRLDERGQMVAHALRLWQEHLASTEPETEPQRRQGAFDRLAHETAFTVLNRLAALRMCEQRGHVIECVRRGMESDGFVLYERFSEGVLGGRGETYQIFLERMFAELSVDLGALFDLDAPQSLVFPRERCLEEVLSLLNRTDLAHLWEKDETIGWIYQYFNSKEEREAMRDASDGPRNSRELAVRNQFFTPRYVVEFLVDNTVGRIWYEMQQGHTALRETCQYLVRRQTEIFLNKGQHPPSSATQENPSHDDPLTQPVYIPYRAKRDPRSIKILDPAVGSGHFLLYAFDLLEAVYREAWEEGGQPIFEPSGKTLREDYADLNALEVALPELILRYNLHGIDIDLRACQIAALALWLRAQHTYQRLRLKSFQRPKITRSNIACAEPMPGEQGLLDQFLTALRPKVISQLVQAVFEKMKLAGEAGSLLKIEEEIADAVTEAKKKWLTGPKPEQGLLFADFARPQQRELVLDFSGITDEAFWEKAEERIYSELRTYAEQATNGGGYQRRLFAEDAARGFAFIDVCRKRYDVVLMNPPFGDASAPSLQRLDSILAACGRDIGAAFVHEGMVRWAPDGTVGALLSTAPWFKPVFESWRKRLFFGPQSQLEVACQFGGEVLDGATVTASPLVLGGRNCRRSLVFRLTREDNLDEALVQRIGTFNRGLATPQLYQVYPAEVCVLPGGPFSYWLSSTLRRKISMLPQLEGGAGTVRQGTATADEPRFARAWWEVPATAEGWMPYTKTSAYSPFWDDITWVGNFRQGLKEILATGKARVQGIDYFTRPGVTYPSKAVLGFNPRLQPSGCGFGHTGSVVFTENVDPLALLGFLGSKPVEYLLSLFIGELQGKAGVHPNHYEVGTIQRLPWPGLTAETVRSLQSSAAACVTAVLGLQVREEPTRSFVSPLLDPNSGIRHNAELAIRNERAALQEICTQRGTADDLVAESFGFETSDRLELDAAFSNRIPPAEGKWRMYFGEAGSDISESEYAQRCVSWFLGLAIGRWTAVPSSVGYLSSPDQLSDSPRKCSPGMLLNGQGLPLTEDDVRHLQAVRHWDYPLDIPWDGILVDDPDNENDIIRRVRQVLNLLWKDNADAIEHETCDILEVKDLTDYFRKPSLFFADHLQRYSKSRRQAPIYWPLSTASGSYTLWVYCHRLSDDSLYAVLNKHVKPKIDDTEKQLRRIESELPNATGREASSLRTAFEHAGTLLDELREFRDELARVADLPYKPNLNDGALITASPLWKLFRLPKWRKDLQECWKKLEAGRYDWAHLAYSIWPDRVRYVCKSDRSIAIAHDLESLCEITAKPAKKKRSKKIAIEETVPGDEE